MNNFSHKSNEGCAPGHAAPPSMKVLEGSPSWPGRESEGIETIETPVKNSDGTSTGEFSEHPGAKGGAR